MERRVQRDEERKRDKVEGEIKSWLERKQKEKKSERDEKKEEQE